MSNMLNFIVKNIGPNLVNVNINENNFCETFPTKCNDMFNVKLDNLMESMHVYNKDNDSLLSIFLHEITSLGTISLQNFKINLLEENSINHKIDNKDVYRISLLEHISKILNKSILILNNNKLIENGDLLLIIEKNNYDIWSLKEKTSLQKYKILNSDIIKNLNKLLVKDLRSIACDLGIDIKINNKFLLKTELREKIKLYL